MSLAATMATFDLRTLLSWWNNWKELVNSAALCFSNARLCDSSLRSTAIALKLLFSHCVPFPRAHWRAGLPGCLRLPMFIISSLGHKMAGVSPLPAIFWHCFQTSEHLDFSPSLQCNSGTFYILYTSSTAHLVLFLFSFFVSHILTVFPFWLWHISHINPG